MSRLSLLVGIGSAHGDDGVGWEVAREVAARLGEQLVVRCASSPAELLGWLDRIDDLVICDAFENGSACGQVRCWQWPADEIAQTPFAGTHDLSLPAVLEIAESLGKLPKRVRIWGMGIQPVRRFGPLSAEARQAAATAAERICEALAIELR